MAERKAEKETGGRKVMLSYEELEFCFHFEKSACTLSDKDSNKENCFISESERRWSKRGGAEKPGESAVETVVCTRRKLMIQITSKQKSLLSEPMKLRVFYTAVNLFITYHIV